MKRLFGILAFILCALPALGQSRFDLTKQAQGGGSADSVLRGGATVPLWSGIGSCSASNSAITWNTGTHVWGCNTFSYASAGSTACSNQSLMNVTLNTGSGPTGTCNSASNYITSFYVGSAANQTLQITGTAAGNRTLNAGDPGATYTSVNLPTTMGVGNGSGSLIDLTGQTATTSLTTIVASGTVPGTGFYLVLVDTYITTANGTATVTPSVKSWKEGGLSPTQSGTAVSCATLNEFSWAVPVYHVAGQNISVQATVSGTIGTCQFSFRARAIALYQ